MPGLLNLLNKIILLKIKKGKCQGFKLRWDPAKKATSNHCLASPGKPHQKIPGISPNWLRPSQAAARTNDRKLAEIHAKVGRRNLCEIPTKQNKTPRELSLDLNLCSKDCSDCKIGLVPALSHPLANKPLNEYERREQRANLVGTIPSQAGLLDSFQDRLVSFQIGLIFSLSSTARRKTEGWLVGGIL